MNAETWPIVIIESPFAGDMVSNRVYAMRACADCLDRHEVPYASHLFFPQLFYPQFLDELKSENPEYREVGITAGYAFWRAASKIVFYTDLGMSPGMSRAYRRAQLLGMVTEVRCLDASNSQAG